MGNGHVQDRSVWICATCGVEHAGPRRGVDDQGSDDAGGPDDVLPEVCAICADERQWVPATGQRWTTVAELSAAGHRTHMGGLEPGLFALTVAPKVGIGHQALVVQTPAGSLLWDPPGFIDSEGVQRISELGPVLAVAGSHPHMFGVQVEWSRALGDPPVLVAAADRDWVMRDDPAIQTWEGSRAIASGLTLVQVGGHFPGSAVAHWTGTADGAGLLLSADTIGANPDRSSVTFMRSFPNRIPLSAAVAQRIAATVEKLSFDRIYDNFGGMIAANARPVIRRSADRYAAWVRGDYDHLT
jgi:hypothetical protein